MVAQSIETCLGQHCPDSRETEHKGIGRVLGMLVQVRDGNKNCCSSSGIYLWSLSVLGLSILTSLQAETWIWRTLCLWLDQRVISLRFGSREQFDNKRGPKPMERTDEIYLGWRSRSSQLSKWSVSGEKCHLRNNWAFQTPFIWKYLGHEYEMEFAGGFVGVSQDSETQIIRPVLGWAVLDTSVDNEPTKKRPRTWMKDHCLLHISNESYKVVMGMDTKLLPLSKKNTTRCCSLTRLGEVQSFQLAPSVEANTPTQFRYWLHHGYIISINVYEVSSDFWTPMWVDRMQGRPRQHWPDSETHCIAS